MTRYPVLRAAAVLALAQHLRAATAADNDQQDGFMMQFSSVGFLFVSVSLFLTSSQLAFLTSSRLAFSDFISRFILFFS